MRKQCGVAGRQERKRTGAWQRTPKMVLFGAFDADQKFRKITFVSVHAGVAHQVVNVQISDGLKVTSFKKLQEVFRVFNLRLQRTAHDIAGIQAGRDDSTSRLWCRTGGRAESRTFYDAACEQVSKRYGHAVWCARLSALLGKELKAFHKLTDAALNGRCCRSTGNYGRPEGARELQASSRPQVASFICRVKEASLDLRAWSSLRFSLMMRT